MYNPSQNEYEKEINDRIKFAYQQKRNVSGATIVLNNIYLSIDGRKRKELADNFYFVLKNL